VVAHPRRTWVWWLLGGIVVLVGLGIFGSAVAGVVLLDRFQHGSFSCLPADFPHYPGTTVSGESTSGRECGMTYDSKYSVTLVGPWYQTNLDNGDWKVDSVDYTHGTIAFHRVSRHQTSGTVSFTRLGDGTRIRVVLDQN